MKILIVDDNPENLELMNLMLQSQDYNVVSAQNGKEALDLLKSEKVDLIISDILMPVMDGFKFCKECKKDPELKNITFIFYTATYVDKKDEEFALSLGAVKFVRKPQEPDVFISIIKEIIDKSEYFEEIDQDILHNDKEIYKLYSERLVNKLEKKNLDLEKEIAIRQQREIELFIAKEKAEESNKLKSAFLKNLYHEIRTPMNGILGFLDLLKQTDLSNEKRERYIDIIQKSGMHLISIIDDIVEMSKIETRQTKLYINSFNINNLMQDLYEVFELNIEDKKGIELFYIRPTDKYDPIVKTDEHKLRRILTHLLNNAIKFTKVGKIEFGFEIKNEKLYIFVKDTGIGIDKNHFEMIFERFTMVENDITSEEGGSGLGLALSKAYVELLGGKMELDSEIGKGSNFRFHIPLN